MIWMTWMIFRKLEQIYNFLLQNFWFERNRETILNRLILNCFAMFSLTYGWLDLVHRHHVGAHLTLSLLGPGQEGGEALGHAGDRHHVAVGDHGVQAGAARLGRVPGQVLGISAENKGSECLNCQEPAGESIWMGPLWQCGVFREISNNKLNPRQFNLAIYNPTRLGVDKEQAILLWLSHFGFDC